MVLSAPGLLWSLKVCANGAAVLPAHGMFAGETDPPATGAFTCALEADALLMATGVAGGDFL